MKSFSESMFKKKLISGFVLVAVLAGAIGIIGDINLKMLDERDGSLYAKATVSLHSLQNASAKFHELVLLNQKLRTDNAPESFMAASEGLEGRGEGIEKELRQFSAVMADSSSRAAVIELTYACRKYVEDTKAYYQLGVDGQLFEAKKYHHAVLGADHNAVSAAFMNMTDANVAETKQGREENSDIFESMRTLMFILVGTAIAAALGLGVYLTLLTGKFFLQQEGFMASPAPAFAGAAVEPPVAQIVPVADDAAPTKFKRSAPVKSSASASLHTASAPARTAQDPTKPVLAAAAAPSGQPVKKMRVFFDDTAEFAETESYNYR